MTLATRSAPLVLATALALRLLPGAARADSQGGRPDEHSSIRHADSVVAGAFTGVTQARTIEQPNAIDAQGRTYTARVQLIVHEFAVSEHLDGASTPALISILVPGALELPAPRRRVVAGIRAEGARPEDGYNLLHGRSIEADTDARLAELRTWVQTVRAPQPVHPQAIAEAVGLHEAELRGDEPVPGAPVGPDLPAGPQPQLLGPPRTAPRNVEPLGDPRHPPEPDAVAAVDEPSVDQPPPWRTGGGARAIAPPRSATPPPAERSPARRWPYMVGAAALLAIASLLWWRRAIVAQR
jgi:hypothetical protein